MNDVEQRVAAKAFAAYWKDKGYEKGEVNLFGCHYCVTFSGKSTRNSSYYLKNRCT